MTEYQKEQLITDVAKQLYITAIQDSSDVLQPIDLGDTVYAECAEKAINRAKIFADELEKNFQAVEEEKKRADDEKDAEIRAKDRENKEPLRKRLEMALDSKTLLLAHNGNAYDLNIESVEYVPKDSVNEGYFNLKHHFNGNEAYEELSETDVADLLKGRSCSPMSIRSDSAMVYNYYRLKERQQKQ